VAVTLLVGEAPSAEFAARVAEQYKDCPHVHFIAAFGAMLVAVWYLPDEKRWWLDLVAEHPQVSLGLRRVALYRTERPGYPLAQVRQAEPWNGPLAPCGSDCRSCDRLDACPGCPALAPLGRETSGP